MRRATAYENTNTVHVLPEGGPYNAGNTTGFVGLGPLHHHQDKKNTVEDDRDNINEQRNNTTYGFIFIITRISSIVRRLFFLSMSKSANEQMNNPRRK